MRSSGLGSRRLQGMKRLRKLDLHGNPILGCTERLVAPLVDGLAPDENPPAAYGHLFDLKDLSLLEELDLSNTEVDNESMAALAGLKNLRRLDLMGTWVRRPGLRRLYGLRQLSVRVTLDSNDLEDIDGSIPIIALKVGSRRVTNDALYHLTLYPMLEELDLHGTNIDDAGMENLAELTALKKLDLSHTRVTDAGLRHLAGLKQLREINLQGTDITPQGQQKLRATLPEVRFDGD